MGLNWALKPLSDKPSIYAKKVSDYISPPNEVHNPGQGFLSGAIEGAGDVLSGMTSPLSLATTAIGMPWARGAVSNLTSLGRIVPQAAKELPTLGPTSIPPEWVERGGESIYNVARQIPKAVRSVDDIIYEMMMNPNRVPQQGKNLLLDQMQKVQAAKGVVGK